MAHKVEPLKDEVQRPTATVVEHRSADASAKGTRTQVVIAGGVAGLVSRFCVAPLDVVKIRLQLQTYSHSLSDPLNRPTRGPVYKGTYGTFKTILREEGLTAFWKGNIPAEALYLNYGAIQFSTYRLSTTLLDSLPAPLHPPAPVATFLSGALAGGVATTLTYPLDLLRTRFAAQGNTRVYTSLMHSVRDIYAREGARGFFQGLGAAVAQIVPYMGLFFAGYEALKMPLAGLQLPVGSGDAVAGMLASVLAKTAVFPLDTVRKRLQVQGPTRGRYVHPDIPRYQGVLGAVGKIMEREGVRGLYRGLPVSLFKAAPTSAVTMWTYGRTMRYLKEASAAEEG